MENSITYHSLPDSCASIVVAIVAVVVAVDGVVLVATVVLVALVAVVSACIVAACAVVVAVAKYALVPSMSPSKSVAFVAAVDFLASLNDEEIFLFAFVASIVDDVEVVDVDENADVVVEAKKVAVVDCKLDTRHFRVFHSRYNYHMLHIELVVAALAVVAVVVDVVDCHFQLPPC